MTSPKLSQLLKLALLMISARKDAIALIAGLWVPDCHRDCKAVHQASPSFSVLELGTNKLRHIDTASLMPLLA